MSGTWSIGLEYRNRRYRDAEAGLRALANNIDQAAERVTPVVRKEIERYLSAVAEALARRHGTRWPSGTTPTSMSRRTGATVRSIQRSVRVRGKTLDSVVGEIGGRAPVTPVQEFGATVRARRAKYLTIPLRAALDSRGVPRRKSARDWDNTFVARSKRGNLIIFQKKGRGIVPLYVLKREVRIPPRLGMQRTIDAGLPAFVDDLSDAALRELVGRNF